MQVDTSVAEADIGKLKPGMDATFTVDAFPGEHVQGEGPADPQRAADACRTWSPTTRSSTSATRSWSCKPGMTANVTFIYDHRDGVLRVPNAALRFQPPAELARAAVGGGGGGVGRKAAGARRRSSEARRGGGRQRRRGRRRPPIGGRCGCCAAPTPHAGARAASASPTAPTPRSRPRSCTKATGSSRTPSCPAATASSRPPAAARSGGCSRRTSR